MKKALMYGGGNIGRGFIGQVLCESGYEVSFVDVNKELVSTLNKEGQYPVRILKGEGFEEVIVNHVSAIDGTDIEAVSDAISGSDLCATAVGVNVLKFIAKPFKEGIVKRFTIGNKKPLDIIICENLIGADEYLKGLIKDLMTEEEKKYLENVGFVEASIGRMVPVQTDEMKDGNPLRVCVESYNRLPVDKAAFKGEIPAIENLVPYTPFSYYIERKLFVHNMGHAACAYLGKYCGKEFIYEAINIPEVELIVIRAMTESINAMSKKYSVDTDPLFRHVENLIYRFSNKQLGDTASRVGGDIKRKLSPNDRLVGAYNLCKEMGTDNTYIALAIAASLLFEREGEEKLKPEYILTEISKIEKDSEDYKKIMNIYDCFKEGKSLNQILKEVKEQQNKIMIV
ncbi:MAG: mannitol dehydrogenase [Bacillota bacterium]|nr:mannitol dehydrogenase [Bacillota bacterium]